MRVYLGLGSNEGDRRRHLASAVAALETAGASISRISPVVESPALLPERAPVAWNRPFLNLVVEAEVAGTPQHWRDAAKAIEHRLGRRPGPRWSPRPIDIDILLWGREVIRGDSLTIPQEHLHRRAFDLTPLAHLDPTLTIPGRGERTVLQWCARLPHRIPLWMGILNATPDSFSGAGGRFQWPDLAPAVEQLVNAGAHIIDIGAESTRPGATPLTPHAEWSRLEPVLRGVLERLGETRLRPLVSVDTRHPEVAAKALEAGADIINDTGGLASPEMIALARSSTRCWVAMHSLSIPADPQVTLPPDRDPCGEVLDWLADRLDAWQNAGLDLSRIIFDPGIGFGKDDLQSLELLRHIDGFQGHGLRTLVGHSRKLSFGRSAAVPAAERDIETVGASLKLCQKGVDILRVHDVESHARAYRAWAHLE